MGLMQGIELVEDRKTKEPAPQRTAKALEAAKKFGLLVGKGGLYGNVIRIAPSMLVSAAEVDDAAARLDKAFAEV
jgi:4-aminobutyrate aminotransferase-like enzyme